MTFRLVITGTDTDVGKTVFAAALADALDAAYWKPIQAGLEDGGDSAVVQRLGGLDASRIMPEAYRLTQPASPHIAAERDGIAIEALRLELPVTNEPLVIEGAGGLMVPLSRDLLQIDMLARWRVPAVLVARTALGTINHSLLSLEALARRDIPVIGIAFTGEPNARVQQTISDLGRTRDLGCLPPVAPLDRAHLQAAFRQNFSVADFLPGGGR